MLLGQKLWPVGVLHTEKTKTENIIMASVGQINGKVIQIELNYSDQSNLIRIKINVFLKVIRIELN